MKTPSMLQSQAYVIWPDVLAKRSGRNFRCGAETPETWNGLPCFQDPSYPPLLLLTSRKNNGPYKRCLDAWCSPCPMLTLASFHVGFMGYDLVISVWFRVQRKFRGGKGVWRMSGAAGESWKILGGKLIPWTEFETEGQTSQTTAI